MGSPSEQAEASRHTRNDFVSLEHPLSPLGVNWEVAAWMTVVREPHDRVLSHFFQDWRAVGSLEQANSNSTHSHEVLPPHVEQIRRVPGMANYTTQRAWLAHTRPGTPLKTRFAMDFRPPWEAALFKQWAHPNAEHSWRFGSCAATNFQVSVLSGELNCTRLGVRHVVEAARRLLNFSVVLPLDELEGGLAALARPKFGWQLGVLDDVMQSQATSRNHADFFHVMGHLPQVVRHVREQNYLDDMLYRFAKLLYALELDECRSGRC